MNWSMKLHRNAAEAHTHDVLDGIDDAFIESIWQELDGQLPLARVRCVVTEITRGFQGAAVKTFLPILVHRQTLEKLKQDLNNMDSADGQSQEMQLQDSPPLSD